MAFSKKTWKDRVSEQPQRRLLTPTSGGSSYTVDVQRQEGIVVQEGDAFSAANMNDLENRIKSTFDADEATLNTVNTKANTNASNITTLQTNVNTLNNSKAPNNHASSAPTYGKGSTSAFGHLKISDNYTSSAGNASDGVAASSKAVVDARTNAINTAASDATSKANAAQSAAISTAANDATNKANAAQSAAISAAASDATTKANAAYNNANSASETRYNDIVGELTANNKRIYMDYKNGKYGYNTSANRGADTFHPFKQTLQFDYFQVITSGPLVISNALQYDNIIVVASQAGEIWAGGDHVITINVEGGNLSSVHPNDDDCEAFYQKNRRAGVITPTANTVTITLSSPEAFNYPHIMAYCIIN